MTRKRVWEIVEIARAGDKASRAFDFFILSLIAINIICFILESIPALRNAYGPIFATIEIASLVIFSVEYLLRVWSCVEDERFREPVKGRLRYMRRPLVLIDLIVILPFILMLFGADLRALRAFRLVRVFRIGKLGRYYPSLNLIINVIWNKKTELLFVGVIVVIVTITTGSLIYTAEHAVQPDKFSDIPTTLRWSLHALAKLNLGGVYPVTALGETLFSIIGILGTLVFALPTAVVVAGFMDEWKKNKKDDENKCPHCGKRIV